MSDEIPYYFKTKQELLDKLNSLRPEIEKLDKAEIAKHKKDEQYWLKCFRESVRKRSKALLAMDYQAAKDEHRYGGATIRARNAEDNTIDTPSCPVSMVEILNKAIAVVERSSERAFRIRSGGDYSIIHRALTLGIAKAGAIC